MSYIHVNFLAIANMRIELAFAIRFVVKIFLFILLKRKACNARGTRLEPEAYVICLHHK